MWVWTSSHEGVWGRVIRRCEKCTIVGLVWWVHPSACLGPCLKKKDWELLPQRHLGNMVLVFIFFPWSVGLPQVMRSASCLAIHTEQQISAPVSFGNCWWCDSSHSFLSCKNGYLAPHRFRGGNTAKLSSGMPGQYGQLQYSHIFLNDRTLDCFSI